MSECWLMKLFELHNTCLNVAFFFFFFKSSLVHWAGQEAHLWLKTPDPACFKAPSFYRTMITHFPWCGVPTFHGSHVLPHQSNGYWRNHSRLKSLMCRLQEKSSGIFSRTEQSAALFNHSLIPLSTKTHKDSYDWGGPSQGLLFLLLCYVVSLDELQN